MKQIQHKHLIIRAEINLPPVENIMYKKGFAYVDDRTVAWLNKSMEELIKAIGMKVVLPARAVWIGELGNEGYTGQAGLETSHLTYHIWNNPEREIMFTDAPGLLQFDLYTCGCLNEAEERFILDKLDKMFQFVHAQKLLLDRAISLHHT